MPTPAYRTTLLLLLLAALLLARPAPAPAETVAEIMTKHRDLHRVRDEEETVAMKLVAKNGESKQRRITRHTLTVDGLSKILMRFVAPRDVEGTGLLIWEAKDGNDDQWLYLPAAKKAKRIPSSGKKNRFMGTDFSYEDLGPEALPLYTWTLVGSETLDGQDCHVVDAVPASERKAADSGYSRRRLWLRKDNYYVVKREYWDRKGKLEKVEHVRKLVPVKGTVWRADETEMHDMQAGTRTVLTVEKRAIERGLKDSFFTETELTR